MNIPTKLEQRVSKKTDEPYYCLVINLTDTYEKVVFLDRAELELLRATSKLDGQSQKVKLNGNQ